MKKKWKVVGFTRINEKLNENITYLYILWSIINTIRSGGTE